MNRADATDPALEARFRRIRFRLNRELPFLAHLLNRVAPRPAPVGTARARDTGEWGEIYVDPDFAAQLDDAQLGIVWAHEVLHLAFGFFRRRGHRDLARFNRAHDYAVNLVLDDFRQARPGVLDWTPEPWIPYLDRAYEGLAAEEIYDRLAQEEEVPPPEGRGYPDATDCEPDPEGGPGEGEAALREQRWRIALAEAAERHAQAGAGPLPAHLEVLVGSALRPRVPWAERVLHAVEGHLRGGRPSYARPSRRGMGAGILLPGPSRRRPRLGVVLDTSASVQEAELAAFLGVLRRLADASPVSLRVMEVDAAVVRDRDVEDLDAWLAAGVRLRGRGGTDFDGVPGALAFHPELEPVDLALLLTDGEPQRWPEPGAWPCPMVVATTRTMPPAGYEAVRIELD